MGADVRALALALAVTGLATLAGCGAGSSGSAPPAPSSSGGAAGSSSASRDGGPTDASSSGGGAGGAAAPGGAGGAAPGGAGGAAGATGAGAGGAAGRATTDGGAAGRADAAGGSPDAGAPDAGVTTCNTAGAATARTPTVYVIGDSTASVYTSDLFPRMGWAQLLQDYFAPACATIQDKALSGRSSKSFFDEGHWTPIKAALRAGDTVLIQFGHNDEKTDQPALGTDPFTTFEMYLSIYIDDTIAAGGTPILITSINRNDWNGTALADTHGNYPVAMRQLAPAKKVALVDATALTKAYFERIGQTATTALFMDLAPGQFPNYPNGNTDNTHLQEKGARTIAQLTLADMYRQGLAVSRLLKAVPQAP